MQRWRKLLTSTIIFAVFCGAMWLLYQQVRKHDYQQIVAALREISHSRIALAGLLTIVNYLVLMVYDMLALKAIGHALPLRRVAVAACVGYSVSNNFGALLGGSAVRYRLYSSWGLSTVDIVQVLAMIGVVFWIGMFGLAGTVFLVAPLEVPLQIQERIDLPITSTRLLGAVLLAIAVGYQVATIVWRRPVKIRDWKLSLPPAGLSALQLLVSALDLLVAAGVLYALLPGAEISYWKFVGVYLLAVTSVVLTHVPGGLGVFEVVILAMLPDHPSEQILGSLLAFRFIYYLAPLGLGTVLMGLFEVAQRGPTFQRWFARSSLVSPAATSPTLVPRMVSILSVLAGAILLVASATPVSSSRLDLLVDSIPWWLVEAAHFASGLIAVALLILGYPLQRRSWHAFRIVAVLIALGIVTCLLRGFDFEEATILAVLLLAFLPLREHFYRRVTIVGEPPSLQWLASVSFVLLVAMAVGAFVHRRQPYEHGLWLQFSIGSQLPRFLRLSIGVSGLLALTACWRMLQRRPKQPQLPTAGEIAAAAEVLTSAPQAYGHVALAGDKHLLISENRQALLMYGIAHEDWIALGDPIGPLEEQRELAWTFRELCDRRQVGASFYGVSAERQTLYLDLGLTLLKLGDLARVPLRDFSLAGPERRQLRHTDHRLLHEHCRWEMMSVEQAAKLPVKWRRGWTEGGKATAKIPVPRSHWLGAGYEQEAYWSRFPRAVVWRGGHVIATGLVYGTAGREELAVDLIRLAPDAPPGTADFLVAELLEWGRQAGYQSFNLGLAPHHQSTEPILKPLWDQVGPAIYPHGELFSSFAALRHFKEQFDPVWEPRYLATAPGNKLSLIVQNLATLLAHRDAP
jgi:phosphatidylglycerol lysyltransferase